MAASQQLGGRQLALPECEVFFKQTWHSRVEVPSESGEGSYVVAQKIDGSYGCSCPGWKFHHPRKPCKHIRQVIEGSGTLPS